MKRYDKEIVSRFETPLTHVGIPINPFTLQFKEEVLNRDFAAWIRKARILQIRMAFLLVSVLYLIYGLSEPWFAPEEIASTAQILHIGLIMPLTLFIALYPASKFLEHYFVPMAVTMTLIAFLVYLYLMVRTGVAGPYRPELYFMILWFFTVSGFRLHLATLFSLILVVAAIATVSIFSTPANTPEALYTFYFWLFIAFSLGFVGGHLLEYWAKINFYNMRTLHREIVERQNMEEQLRHLSEHDNLTGLCNRSKLSREFRNAAEAADATNTKLAWLFVDIDHFKHFNDTAGHIAGDNLLKLIAQRLLSSVRQKDHIGRIGGDEFIVLLTDIGHAEDALKIAEKIRVSLTKPYRLSEGDETCRSSASIGIALYPEHGSSEIELYKCADAAMYHSKKRGRNSVTLFSPHS